MNRRTALIFYILSAYVIIQFLWWGYHIIELSEEVSKESTQVSSRIRMIISEGSVFLILVLIGIWQIRRSIRKDLKLSERQNNFLLSVTHELKTPLAANKLYIQTIQKRDLNKEQTDGLLKKSIEENTRLEHMINNILNASSLENNAFNIEKEEFDLVLLVKSIQKRFETISNQKISTSFSKDRIMLRADKFSIETIINNLVENAIKYSESNSLILIYASEKDTSIEFGVVDNGIGISKENKVNVFNKFYRVGNEEVRTQNGTGLGLFIVAELIRKHNGKITCFDNNPKGTNFKITLQND